MIKDDPRGEEGRKVAKTGALPDNVWFFKCNICEGTGRAGSRLTKLN